MNWEWRIAAYIITREIALVLRSVPVRLLTSCHSAVPGSLPVRHTID
jgi:hypothetical protein